VLGSEAEGDRERYIRVAAVVIAASEGIKNICFREFREALLIVQKRRHQIEGV
jgi:hypothetical protein